MNQNDSMRNRLLRCVTFSTTKPLVSEQEDTSASEEDVSASEVIPNPISKVWTEPCSRGRGRSNNLAVGFPLGSSAFKLTCRESKLCSASAKDSSSSHLQECIASQRLDGTNIESASSREERRIANRSDGQARMRSQALLRTDFIRHGSDVMPPFVRAQTSKFGVLTTKGLM